ncbi:MAG: hypothetical protein JNK37_12715 [Verrucomicrobiales bacterium]|nr:hypothetical protein [Verrucomicrobiales bacterium]
MANPNDTAPLQQLKHDAVPGYPRAFLICFAVMALYLLLILISSPGPAASHHPHPNHDDSSAPSH